MLNIILAYSHLDVAGAADYLAVRLRQLGLSVAAYAGDAGGPDVDLTVLQAAHVVLALLTPQAVASERVRGQWQHALGLGKRVIPVQVSPCASPPGLSGAASYDLSRPATYDQVLAMLVQDLVRGSAQTAPSGAGPTFTFLGTVQNSSVGVNPVVWNVGSAPSPAPQPTATHPEILERLERKGDGPAGAPESLHGTGRRWAVLVGVNEYEDKPNYGRLNVCIKDVEAIRERLVAGGFAPERIRLLADHTAERPTRANVLTALKAVADATEPDDLLLFYYSGHGDEAGGESYLVARDGRRLVLDDTAVSVSRAKAIMEQAPARAKVIILDACHSGADIGGKGPKPMSEAFIRRVFEQAEGLAILASCKQGQLSYEWQPKERSVFTHCLLEALSGQADRDEKGFVTVEDARRHVTDGVKLWASQHNISQTPTLQAAIVGDIILARYTTPGSGGG